jgi:hypothetical protein
MIDRYFAGPCEDCLEDKHEDCTDSECRCDECDERARADADEMRYEAWKEWQRDQGVGLDYYD